jgi:hypothetical protein
MVLWAGSALLVGWIRAVDTDADHGRIGDEVHILGQDLRVPMEGVRW